MTPAVKKLCDDFASALDRAIAVGVNARLEMALVGLPATHLTAPGLRAKATVRAARRKGPIQLCPAPRCAARAAPVYGMLCTKHKGTPKPIVAKWREARRARKGG